MDYIKMNSEQAKTLVNATQLFEALEQRRRNDDRFKGSLHWKNINGRDYLYRGYSHGRNHSLGPRSAQTETSKQRFDEGRAEHQKLVKNLIAQGKIHAGYIKVNRLNRFPAAGARVVRAFQKEGIPHRIIGTNALYVYEIGAGVLIMPEHLTTEDMDMLVDANQRLKVAARLNKRTLLSIIRETDKSFKRLSDSPFEFAAVNDRGYRVEIVTRGNPDPMQPDAFTELLQKGDLQPVQIDSLKWFLSSPRYSEIVFDEQGMPLRVDTVDPRAFVLHKWYVSQRDDRRPVKRKRDEDHARVMADILSQELRHLPATSAIRKLFPRAVIDNAPYDTDKFSI